MGVKMELNTTSRRGVYESQFQVSEKNETVNVYNRTMFGVETRAF